MKKLKFLRKHKEVKNLVFFFLFSSLALFMSTSAIAGEWCDWMNDTKVLLDAEKAAIFSEKNKADEIGTISLDLANDPDIESAVEDGEIDEPLVLRDDIRAINELRKDYNRQVRGLRDLAPDWDELTVLVCNAEA